MRLDLWLLSGTLMGMGIMKQDKVCHESMLLAASVNRRLNMEIEGQAIEPSFMLIDSRIPYSIFPGDDWQFFAYINEKSYLAKLLRLVLKGKSYLSITRVGEPPDWLSSFASDEYRDFQVEELFHSILLRIFQIQSYPLDWNSDLKKILHYINKEQMDCLSISSMAQYLKLTPRELKIDFLRITGIPLADYLVAIRVSRAFQLIQRGHDGASSFEQAGLPSQRSMEEFFQQKYALDVGWVLEEKPVVRFAPGDLNRFSGYSNLSSS